MQLKDLWENKSTRVVARFVSVFFFYVAGDSHPDELFLSFREHLVKFQTSKIKELEERVTKEKEPTALQMLDEELRRQRMLMALLKDGLENARKHEVYGKGITF